MRHSPRQACLPLDFESQQSCDMKVSVRRTSIRADQQGAPPVCICAPEWSVMNPQFKKGVLELIVLESVRQRDMYGYELVEEVSQVIDVNEGTIYPLLKRLTNEHYFETYLRESSEGPPRKYYHLTAAGILYRDRLTAEWDEFQTRVNEFLKGRDGRE